jgi:hypothetical protein
MAWKDFGSSLAITRRRRVVATALMYGLTLTVRFTSATSEDADAQAFQSANPMTSVMISDAAQALSRDWLPGATQPISFQRGSLLGPRGCRMACEPATRTPFVSSCAAHQ